MSRRNGKNNNIASLSDLRGAFGLPTETTPTRPRRTNEEREASRLEREREEAARQAALEGQYAALRAVSITPAPAPVVEEEQKEYIEIPFENIEWESNMFGVVISRASLDAIWEMAEHYPKMRTSYAKDDYVARFTAWAAQFVKWEFFQDKHNLKTVYMATDYVAKTEYTDYWQEDENWGLHEADDAVHVVNWGQKAVSVGLGGITTLPENTKCVIFKHTHSYLEYYGVAELGEKLPSFAQVLGEGVVTQNLAFFGESKGEEYLFKGASFHEKGSLFLG